MGSYNTSMTRTRVALEEKLRVDLRNGKSDVEVLMQSTRLVNDGSVVRFLPNPRFYKHFMDRLNDMTFTSTMPGDLELNAISSALEKQILVADSGLRPVVVYGQDFLPENSMKVVRFTRLGKSSGHYDAVLPDLDSLMKVSFHPDPYWKTNNHINIPLDTNRQKDFGSCLMHLVQSTKSEGDWKQMHVQKGEMKDSSDKVTQVPSQILLNSCPRGEKSTESESRDEEQRSRNYVTELSSHKKQFSKDVTLDPLDFDQDLEKETDIANQDETTDNSSGCKNNRKMEAEELKVKNEIAKQDKVTTSGKACEATSGYNKKNKVTQEKKCDSTSKGMTKRKLQQSKKQETKSKPAEKDSKSHKIYPNMRFKASRPSPYNKRSREERRCFICKQLAMKGNKIVTCIVCLRTAHQKSVKLKDCDIEAYHCSYCLTTFKEID